MQLKQIGIVQSSYKDRKDAPRQGKFSDETSILVLEETYLPALTTIEELSHIIVLYWGNKANREILESPTPWSPDVIRGVFTTRSPNRPNPIAFCVCKIINIDGNKIEVSGLDALDGSPLLDIKAYAPDVDCYPEANRKE